MKKVIIYSAFVLFFAACEKTAEIELPQSDPMIAIFGFVEAGKNVEIKVEEVVAIFGKKRVDPYAISGALVLLKEGSNSYLLTEDPSIPGTYTFPGGLQGEAGKSYQLEVSAAGFPSVKASCTVPTYLPSAVKHNYVAVPDPNEFTDSVRRIGFTWADQAGQENYFRVTALATFSQFSTSIVEYSDKNIEDDAKDGQELYSGLGYFYNQNSGGAMTDLEVDFELIALDVNAYKYLRTFDVAYISYDNPFAEPVIMYSNIEGGIGVFGGVNRRFFNVKIY